MVFPQIDIVDGRLQRLHFADVQDRLDVHKPWILVLAERYGLYVVADVRLEQVDLLFI